MTHNRPSFLQAVFLYKTNLKEEHDNMKTAKPNIAVRLKSDLILLSAAIVWGGGFVAQRIASAHMDFFAFNGVRFLLGGLRSEEHTSELQSH